MGKFRWRVQLPERGWTHRQPVASNSHTSLEAGIAIHTENTDVPDRFGGLQMIRFFIMFHPSIVSHQNKTWVVYDGIILNDFKQK